VTLLSGRCDGCGANLVLPSHNKAKVEAMEVPMVHTNLLTVCLFLTYCIFLTMQTEIEKLKQEHMDRECQLKLALEAEAKTRTELEERIERQSQQLIQSADQGGCSSTPSSIREEASAVPVPVPTSKPVRWMHDPRRKEVSARLLQLWRD